MSTSSLRAALPPALRDLAGRLAGRVLSPADPDYAGAISLFNAAVDHRPDHVVQARSTADVVATVRTAREHGLDLSVRGGGHGVAGLATAGRLVLDLSLMRDVAVHAGRRRARAQGGCTWSDVDTATQRHGLATPGGRVTHTGIAGLTLGGGHGWLSPRHGLTCDNLVSAEVVTADGQVVLAGPGGDEDLLWALRGGGGGFGVVTRFDYRLHEVGPTVLGGPVLHPLESAAEVAAAYSAVVDTAGPDFAGALVFTSAPPAPFLPPSLVGAPVLVTTLAWFGDSAAGERVLRPIRSAGTPLADLVGPLPYTVLQELTDAPSPRGMRNYWSAGYLPAMTAEVVAAAAERTLAKGSPLSAVVFAQMGEAVRAVDEDATAYPHREAAWLAHPMAMWADPAQDEAEIAWLRATQARLRPFESGGSYLNTDSAHVDGDRVRAAYGPAKSARLSALKATYDPDGLLRHAPGLGQRKAGVTDMSPDCR